MIPSAVRLPITKDGSFSGKIADLLRSKPSGEGQPEFRNISEWNADFRSASPNGGRSKGLEELSYFRDKLGHYLDDLVDRDGLL